LRYNKIYGWEKNLKKIVGILKTMFTKITSFIETNFKKGFKVIILSFFCISLSTTYTGAQQNQLLQKIEALVNDEIISAYDLNQRLGLVVASTGGVNTEEEYLKLRDQVLKSMVDERLQLQEAREYEVVISDAEVEDAFTRIAESFGQDSQTLEVTLAKEYNSSKRSLTDQLRAEYTWQRLVQGKLGSQVVISDEDVEASIDRMKANAGKFEYSVSEIYFILDNPSRDSVVKQAAERVHQQLIDGAQFSLVARQFSESSSAARGGDLGWVSADQLDPQISSSLETMEVLETSNPIKTAGGYSIITLSDRRRILSNDPLDVELDLWQIYKPYIGNPTQEKADALSAVFAESSNGITSCADISQVAAEIGTSDSGKLGDISLRQLSPQMRPLFIGLEDGHPTQPATSNDGVRMFFVCGRTDPEIKEPSFDEMFGQLEQQRLSMMARRYLRDLRRDAIIDYR